MIIITLNAMHAIGVAVMGATERAGSSFDDTSAGL